MHRCHHGNICNSKFCCQISLLSLSLCIVVWQKILTSDPRLSFGGGGGLGMRASLVPSPFYCMWEKCPAKRIFNFGSVQQDLDTANQIAGWCLRHGHVWKKKDCDSNLKEQTEDWLPLIQQVIDEANCCLSSAKCTQSLGEVRSLAVCMQTNFSAQFYCVSIIIRHRHQREPKLNTHFIRLSFPSPPNRKESLGSRLDKKKWYNPQESLLFGVMHIDYRIVGKFGMHSIWLIGSQ